ncbi:hypothetical protein DID88_001937 [Monilinia fructigena]|uniref:Uncharacterized protein n=1 Tax=Monilinia fructigena TaxID=38457 RepID=A0A395IWE2_9HELO|nr:hypothetical protein DID88_001937 [Monilinia fructigena]
MTMGNRERYIWMDSDIPSPAMLVELVKVEFRISCPQVSGVSSLDLDPDPNLDLDMELMSPSHPLKWTHQLKPP